MNIAEQEAEKLIARYEGRKASALEIETLKRMVLDTCPALSAYPNRLAACMCLASDIGLVNFRSSTVARYVRQEEYRAAADAFMLWVYSSHTQQKDKVKRRQEERTVFRREEGR